MPDEALAKFVRDKIETREIDGVKFAHVERFVLELWRWRIFVDAAPTKFARTNDRCGCDVTGARDACERKRVERSDCRFSSSVIEITEETQCVDVGNCYAVEQFDARTCDIDSSTPANRATCCCDSIRITTIRPSVKHVWNVDRTSSYSDFVLSWNTCPIAADLTTLNRYLNIRSVNNDNVYNNVNDINDGNDVGVYTLNDSRAVVESISKRDAIAFGRYVSPGFGSTEFVMTLHDFADVSAFASASSYNSQSTIAKLERYVVESRRKFRDELPLVVRTTVNDCCDTSVNDEALDCCVNANGNKCARTKNASTGICDNKQRARVANTNSNTATIVTKCLDDDSVVSMGRDEYATATIIRLVITEWNVEPYAYLVRFVELCQIYNMFWTIEWIPRLRLMSLIRTRVESLATTETNAMRVTMSRNSRDDDANEDDVLLVYVVREFSMGRSHSGVFDTLLNCILTI